MPADAVISVRGISKRFGGLLALAFIDFDVMPGDIFGIIGPNGAGKTTLFSCLVGAVEPTSGEIRFREICTVVPLLVCQYLMNARLNAW